MTRVKIRIYWAMIFTAVIFISGCGNKFFDPTQIGRFRPTPVENVILDSLQFAKETSSTWEYAEEPRRSDIIVDESDYVLRSGDIIQVTIFELLQEGETVIKQYVITESGNVSILDIGTIQAAGLTETQLEEEIRQILSPAILKDPTVSVSLVNSQQRTFSILGDGIPGPGRYVIPRYGFRLNDALAMAGSPRQFNVTNIYVLRYEDRQSKPVSPGKNGLIEPLLPELEIIEPGAGSSSTLNGLKSPSDSRSITNGPIEPTQPTDEFELEREMLDMITPYVNKWPSSDKVIAASSTTIERPAGQNRTTTKVPDGFTLLNKPQNNQELYATNIVQTPSVFSSSNTVSSLSSSGSQQSSDVEWIYEDGTWKAVPRSMSSVPVEKKVEPAGGINQTDSLTGLNGTNEWDYQDGRWIPSQSSRIPTASTRQAERYQPEEYVLPLDEPEPMQMELDWDKEVKARLIKIPVNKLLEGDPRYNIVIKPGDTIHVPVDIVGEFCITGNVNRSGYINITGRPMTLKMAIAAAGGLGSLAYPKNCEVVRRIGEDREEIVMVNLDKIASGEQPDFFIKPNDLINVGTHPTSRWRAILRNSFRAAYGFGLVYDRNFYGSL